MKFNKKIKDIIFLNNFKSIIIIMLLVILYYIFIAANRYVSHSIITIKATSNDSNITITGLGGILGSKGTGTNEDISFLKSYISSPDMLKVLEKEINIKELYASEKIDFLFKINKNINNDDFLEYYQNRIKIKEIDGLLHIQTEGFTPEQATKINLAILKESERFVNDLSHKNAKEQLDFAESELYKYKLKYQEATNALIIFQKQHKVFDPNKEIDARADLVMNLQAKLIEKEVELSTLKGYIQENAPQITLLKAEIKAIKEQLSKEKALNDVNLDNTKLNDIVSKFETLKIEAGFAENAYIAALKAYETTRIETIKKIKHLAIIQNPNKPDEALYPRKIYNIISIFVILSLIFGIVRLIRTIIQEHKY